MAVYKKLYTRMFNAATDALRALEQGNILEAKVILTEAQQRAEEDYISTEETAQRPIYIMHKNEKTLP